MDSYIKPAIKDARDTIPFSKVPVYTVFQTRESGTVFLKLPVVLLRTDLYGRDSTDAPDYNCVAFKGTKSTIDFVGNNVEVTLLDCTMEIDAHVE